MYDMSSEVFDFSVPLNLQPRLTDDNRPYWEAAGRGRFKVPHCRACGRKYFPISPRCPDCLSDDIDFESVEPKASIASWVRYRKMYYPWTAEAMPYLVALLDVVPGVRLPMLMRPQPRRDPRIGEQVDITFMRLNETITLPICTLSE
jgi:uncharacterized protein